MVFVNIPQTLSAQVTDGNEVNSSSESLNIPETTSPPIVASVNMNNGQVIHILSSGEMVKFDSNQFADLTYGPRALTEEIPSITWEQASQIKAAINWGNGKIYILFKNNTYSRFDIFNWSVDPEYPLPMDDSNWPEIFQYRNQISAALEWDT